MGSAMHRSRTIVCADRRGTRALFTLRWSLLSAVNPCQRRVSKQLSAESAFGSVAGAGSITARNAIIIGFVGGFVRRDDMNHPEVQFAEYLRQTYPSIVHAEVFANHDGKHALRRVLQLLDTSGDGVLAPSEKEQASIIILWP